MKRAPDDAGSHSSPMSLDSLLNGLSQEPLETSVLPKFITAQRWFGGKARRVDRMRIADWCTLDDRLSSIIAFVEVQFADTSLDLYCLPLSIATGDEACAVLQESPNSVLTQFASADGQAVLYDALVNDTFCEALLAAIAGSRDIRTQRGAIHGTPTQAFDRLRGPAGQRLKIQHGSGATANSAVVYGNRMILKLFRRLEAGPNPDLELGLFLTEKTSFQRTPPTAGACTYEHPGTEPMTLAVLQGWVNNAGNGWEHALGEVQAFLVRSSGNTRTPHQIEATPSSFFNWALESLPAFVTEAIGRYLNAAKTLAKRTAELHLALCAGPDQPAFAPEPITAADHSKLVAGWKEQARKSLAGLEANIGSVPEPMRESASWLLQQRAMVLERLGTPPAANFQGAKIRCHGDYHLGQVLWTEGDFVILDFEGEPARPLAERRAKESPLRDVAGMLRSFDYAAYAGLFTFTEDRPEMYAPLAPWARIWQQGVSALFVKEYAATAAGSPFFPAELGNARPWLERFILEKAFYELDYELNNRPAWLRIPLAGIVGLLQEMEFRR